MRSLLVVLVLLLSGVALPGVQAGGGPLVTDAEGDTELAAAYEGSPASVPFTGGDAATVDILSFDVVESDVGLELVLALKSLQRAAGFATYEMKFTWNEVQYVAAVYMHTLPGVSSRADGYLYRHTEEFYYEGMAELEPVVDLDKATISVSFPKVYVIDEDEEVPTKGDELTDVHATARLHLAVFQSRLFGEVVDRAPDGDDARVFTFQQGDLAMGHLRAEPETRVRVSNGGSTTFVYRVGVVNTGEADDEVTVTAENLPEGWNVTVQSPVRIDGEDWKMLTVLASVPFGHTHGGYDSFNVTIQSRTDPGSRASVRLGVLHTPIPQPAGHHSELYLHAKSSDFVVEGSYEPTMNTDPNHETDEKEALPDGTDGGGIYWWIPLNPRLEMGLDFDMERLGSLVGSVIGRGSGEGKVSAELLYAPYGQWAFMEDEGLVLAESDEQTVTLDLQNPTAFSLVMTPTEDADYVPFTPDMSLYLKFRLEAEGVNGFCCITGLSPGLTTADFKLSLPLNEYHDKLKGVAEAAALLDIVAEGPVEKAGRPGTTMTYLFTLKNGGSVDAVIDLDLAGGDAALGTVVPSGAVKLAPKETRKVTLAVAIPPEAKDGQEFEVLIFAHAQDDPSKTAIARTKTTVATKGEAVADESGVLLSAQESEKESPGAGVVGALAALAGVAVLLSRRRRA